MCKKRKTTKDCSAPKGIQQVEMIQEIIRRIEKIVFYWDPTFVISEETSVISDAIIRDISKARDILKTMWLPKSDMLIMDFYNHIIAQLNKFEDSEILHSYSGDTVLKPAAEKVLETVQKWKNLD